MTKASPATTVEFQMVLRGKARQAARVHRISEAPDGISFKDKVVRCVCGTDVTGSTDNALAEAYQQHRLSMGLPRVSPPLAMGAWM